MSSSAVDRVLSRCVVAPSGCWVFGAPPNAQGYGQVNLGGRGQGVGLAHRVVYEELRVEIPAGLHIDHLCRVRMCVNPWHMEPVTRRVNILRGEGVSAKNAVRTQCLKGHPYDLLNTYVRASGGRECRTCMADRKYNRYVPLRGRIGRRGLKELYKPPPL